MVKDTELEEIDKDKLLDIYRKMLRIRYFEEKVYFLFLQGMMPGTIHQYQGQEATAVGICSALREDDFITSTHRPHGHCLAKGMSAKSMMAELFGMSTGCCGGKGGSMHMADISKGVVPAIAIVGAGIPIAAGMGLAFKSKGTDQVVACFFGDGAANQGAFHEGINMASIWQLPVLFVCENNLYAASTPVKETMLVEPISDRAAAYGIPGLSVDGNDVLAVYRVAVEATERARSGEGPTLIECRTYRYAGHSRTDPGSYRPEGELEAWKAKDPIPRFKERLLKLEILKERDAEEIEEAVRREIEEAVTYAQAGPLPTPEDALEDVYG